MGNLSGAFMFFCCRALEEVARVATAPSPGELSDTSVVGHSPTTGLNEKKQEALRIRIPDENFRLFLFYSISKYLEENKRPKKWTANPKVLDVLLGRLEVPVFKTRARVYDLDHNLKMINLVMKEFKSKFSAGSCGRKRFPKGNFHLSQIEEEIQDTDNSIDALVFKLYDLNKDEVITVLNSMETPERVKKDILKKFKAMR